MLSPLTEQNMGIMHTPLSNFDLDEIWIERHKKKTNVAQITTSSSCINTIACPVALHCSRGGSLWGCEEFLGKSTLACCNWKYYQQFIFDPQKWNCQRPTNEHLALSSWSCCVLNPGCWAESGRWRGDLVVGLLTDYVEHLETIVSFSVRDFSISIANHSPLSCGSRKKSKIAFHKGILRNVFGNQSDATTRVVRFKEQNIGKIHENPKRCLRERLRCLMESEKECWIRNSKNFGRDCVKALPQSLKSFKVKMLEDWVSKVKVFSNA